jgi:hypothetical protein
LTSLDFPFTLPLGDLRKIFPSRSDLEKRKAEKNQHTNGEQA